MPILNDYFNTTEEFIELLKDPKYSIIFAQDSKI